MSTQDYLDQIARNRFLDLNSQDGQSIAAPVEELMSAYPDVSVARCPRCDRSTYAWDASGARRCTSCERVWPVEYLRSEQESVGPFPPEPAPGSPEAVKQAAETIRREPDPADLEGLVTLHQRLATAECVAQLYRKECSELTGQRDTLAADVETQRTRLKEVRASESYWKDAAAKALDDLDRQHALAAERSKLIQEAEAHVDELAEVLAQVKARWGRWVRSGIAAGEFGKDSDMLGEIENALRKAGR